ncbi:DUF6728 family protein [Roseivirga sp. BDSF3-8]|uniref:DUF6728 family protein n=1 Tax=Roseivirga sp. BDSF3-8 TaxID=3241598 RepID=UPI003532306A
MESGKKDDVQKGAQNSVKDYFKIGDMFSYFFRVFKKTPEGQPKPNINLRMMHGINKISILMFLAGMIYMVIKHAF